MFCCFRRNIFSGLCETSKACMVLVSQPKTIAHDNQYGGQLFILFSFAQIHKFHYFEVFLQIFSTCVRKGNITLVLGLWGRLQPSPWAKALWLGLICSQRPRPRWWFLKPKGSTNRIFVNTHLLIHKHVTISVNKRIVEITSPHKHVTIFRVYYISVFISRIILEPLHLQQCGWVNFWVHSSTYDWLKFFS